MDPGWNFCTPSLSLFAGLIFGLRNTKPMQSRKHPCVYVCVWQILFVNWIYLGFFYMACGGPMLYTTSIQIQYWCWMKVKADVHQRSNCEKLVRQVLQEGCSWMDVIILMCMHYFELKYLHKHGMVKV